MTEWPAIVEQAAAIVESYDTPVTLRQLFYRLVAGGTIPNTVSAYKRLSEHTARARRDGWFPRLTDRGRVIHENRSFTGPDQAVDWVRRVYRRDRTEGQYSALYLGVEKAGMVEQLEAWFGDFGIPILALGGYSSQSYVDDVADHVDADGRLAVLLYAGDFDPSGEDIDRDFEERTDCWGDVSRIALTASQVEQFNLPPQPGKATDSRAGAFVARHGTLVQVELDALDPDDLRALFQAAIDEHWDYDAYEHALERERTERDSIGVA